MLDKSEFHKVRKIFKRCRFEPYTFTLKLKHSNYKQEGRLQSTAYRINPMKFEDANLEILKRLKIYQTEPTDINQGEQIKKWKNDSHS